MQGDYPRFKVTYTHEELVEHFLLNQGSGHFRAILYAKA